jgi:ornithine cyclodeaminase
MTLTADIHLVSEESLRESVTLKDALGAARNAFRAYSEGKMDIVASVLDLDRGDVHIKGARIVGERYFAVKIASWIPTSEPGDSLRAGGSLICSAETGRPIAMLLDQHYLSDLRTAAAGAVAAELLSRPESATVGVLGTGVQARLQLEAVAEVRPISLAYVHGRRPDASEALVSSLRPALPAIEFTVAGSAEEVMARSDVVVTTTASDEPFVSGEWLRPGQHVSAIGADDDGKAELDAACFTRADRVFVDSVSQTGAIAEIGAAIRAGAFARDQISGEIGEILAGRVAGRTGPDEITIAKMTGIGALDLTIAELALEKCEIQNLL